MPTSKRVRGGLIMTYKVLKFLNESELQELENIILGIESNEELLKQIEITKNKTIDIKKANYTSNYIPNVDNIFKYDLFQGDFEGPYNMLNYIKNYIYYLLKQEKELTPKDVFSDYYEKRKLVTIKIRDISSYLCEIRNGTNLRLCIANAGLSRTANKTGEQFNIQQSLFIDALAFGTTLEKIENREYEDYKKLLYLPNGKELIK